MNTQDKIIPEIHTTEKVLLDKEFSEEIRMDGTLECIGQENSVNIDYHGGITISIGVDGILRDFELLRGYFSATEELESNAHKYFNWGEKNAISPMMLHRAAVSWFYNDLPVSVDMYNLWVEYSMKYLGAKEGKEYIEKELSCPLETVADIEKIRIFEKQYGDNPWKKL